MSDRGIEIVWLGPTPAKIHGESRKERGDHQRIDAANAERYVAQGLCCYAADVRGLEVDELPLCGHNGNHATWTALQRKWRDEARATRAG